MREQCYCFTKRATYALFLFLLISCSESRRCWEHDTICLFNRSHSRLILSPENTFREFGVEIRREDSETYLYVNVQSFEIQEDKENPNKTRVLIETETETNEILADRLEGGQRLRLSSQSSNFIIEKLLNHQVVSLSAGRYCTELFPTGFKGKYRKLLEQGT